MLQKGKATLLSTASYTVFESYVAFNQPITIKTGLG
jgi:hypothetical protein